MASEYGIQSPVITFMVAGGLVFEIVAAMCSSPQTAEINARQRADTLMKWVLIGLAVSALFVIIAASMDKKRWPSILGGGLAGVILWASYDHAKRAGLRSDEPSTEGESSPAAQQWQIEPCYA